MLILTRKVNESVICKLPDGIEIEITIFEMTSTRASIGFKAPDEISIVRDELVKSSKGTLGNR